MKAVIIGWNGSGDFNNLYADMKNYNFLNLLIKI